MDYDAVGSRTLSSFTQTRDLRSYDTVRFDKNAETTTNALLHLNSHGQPILNFSVRNLLYVSPTQREALEAVQDLARRHKLEVPFQDGDMRFINNLALLHSRDDLKKSPGSDQRYLLRMWLRNEKLGWPIPTELQCDWKKSFEDVQGRGRWDAKVMTEEELYDCDSTKCG